jgi:hypothetical protein
MKACCSLSNPDTINPLLAGMGLCVMSCRSCSSNNQTEFGSEIIIHFSGLKNLDVPTVMVFPNELSPSRRELIVMDVPTGQQIAELRREIEGIQELNTIYRNRKLHRRQDQVAHDRRRVRLEEDHAAGLRTRVTLIRNRDRRHYPPEIL